MAGLATLPFRDQRAQIRTCANDWTDLGPQLQSWAFGRMLLKWSEVRQCIRLPRTHVDSDGPAENTGLRKIRAAELESN